MAITLRQIRYFVATAEVGQISQAAIHLHISQSSVTSAIQELEALLGAPLFIRSPQGMILTDSGRHFLNHAYSILRSVDDAMKSPLPDNTASGSLRVAASYTVLGYFLPHHLQRLSQSYPGIKIHVHEKERAEIEQSLVEGEIDMAVVLTSNLRHREIAYETLFGSVRRLWLPARHALGERTVVNLSEVANKPFILLTVDEADKTALRYWNQSGRKPNIIMRTSSIEAVRSMVANGSGVAILSDLVYRPWSLEGLRIETVLLMDHVPAMNVGLAWRKGVTFTPAMEAVREYFRQSFLTPQLSSGRR